MSILVFTLVRLVPGDIVTVLAGVEGSLDVEQEQAIRERYGLDEPLPIQYAKWMGGVVTGDLGYSFRSSQPVSELILDRLPLTLELAVLATFVSVALGLPLGIVAARSRSSSVRMLTQGVGLLGLSIPNFWLGLLSIVFLARTVKWLPPPIYQHPWESLTVNLQQVFLPVLAVAVGLAAVIMRMTRSSVLEIQRDEFVTVARSKGLGERAITRRHLIRPALIPVVTTIGLQFGYLLGGVVLVEQVFGLPGMGWTLIKGIEQRDYAVVQGTILVFAMAFAVVSFIVDMSFYVIDPRTRGR